MSDVKKVKEFLEKLEEENIKFKKHFHDKVRERPISEELVREYIKKTNKLLKIEEQPSKKGGEKKYRLWIKLSNKYNLVVIVVIAKKDLYILTAWNTNRKWQKSIQK